MRFCGEVAKRQLAKGRHFIVEQPWPTWLLHEPPWPSVAQNPRTKSVIIDQCRVGQKGPTGLPAKKPTMLMASSEELLQPFNNLRCTGNREHDVCWGSSHLHHLQKWTWNFAERIVEGIVRLKARLTRASRESGHHRCPGAPRARLQKKNRTKKNYSVILKKA